MKTSNMLSNATTRLAARSPPLWRLVSPGPRPPVTSTNVPHVDQHPVRRKDGDINREGTADWRRQLAPAQ